LQHRGRQNWRQIDQRKVARQGWRSIVWCALQTLGGKAALPEIYNQIKGHARVLAASAAGTDWQAIVRRVLQETCASVDRGVWALAGEG